VPECQVKAVTVAFVHSVKCEYISPKCFLAIELTTLNCAQNSV